MSNHEARAMFDRLKTLVLVLGHKAPEGQDLALEAFGISVSQITYYGGDTLTFRGFDAGGKDCFVVAHYSQIVAKAIWLPKLPTERPKIGFTLESEKKA